MRAMRWQAIAFATLGMSSVASIAEEPVAVLTVARGSVAVVRNGRALADGLPIPLLPGDRVEVASGGTAMLIFPNGAPRKISASDGKTAFRVQGDASRRRKSGGPLSRLWRYVLGSIARRGPEYAPTASRAGDECPEGLWPCNSQVRHTRPVFAWHPVSGAQYQVVLLDGQGNQIWRSPVTDGTQVTYPDYAPGLAHGVNYWWEVLAIADDRMSAAGPYWLRPVSARRADAVEKLLARVDAETRDHEADVRLTARALMLAAEGMQGEALALLASPAHQPPTRDEIDRLRTLVGPSLAR